VLSVQRCLHRHDRRYNNRLCHNLDNQYACAWRDNYDRQLQFGESDYDRRGWGRFDGAEYILPFHLHTNVLRQRWHLLFILDFLSVGIGIMLYIPSRHQRRNGFWCRRWNYDYGAICIGSHIGKQYMQLAQCHCLQGSEHAKVQWGCECRRT
jgi:hypothetical protein